MKNWFEKLPAIWQILLIIISMAFVIALIYTGKDTEIGKNFINLITKAVEVICTNWSQSLLH